MTGLICGIKALSQPDVGVPRVSRCFFTSHSIRTIAVRGSRRSWSGWSNGDLIPYHYHRDHGKKWDSPVRKCRGFVRILFIFADPPPSTFASQRHVISRAVVVEATLFVPLLARVAIAFRRFSLAVRAAWYEVLP